MVARITKIVISNKSVLYGQLVALLQGQSLVIISTHNVLFSISKTTGKWPDVLSRAHTAMSEGHSIQIASSDLLSVHFGQDCRKPKYAILIAYHTPTHTVVQSVQE